MYNLVDNFTSENLNSIEDADNLLKYILSDESAELFITTIKWKVL